MSNVPNAPAGDQKKAAEPLDDLARSRAKESLDRYESMRGLEWRIVFQLYAGYAVLAVAFIHLADEFRCHASFLVLALGATVTFFAAVQYVYFRIQERLIVFNETHESYMRKVRQPENIGQENADLAEDSLIGRQLGQGSLGHQYFWTYDAQLTISTLVCAGMLAYEFLHIVALGATDKKPSAWPLWVSVVLAILIAFLARIRLAIRLGVIKSSIGGSPSDWFSKMVFSIYSTICSPKKPLRTNT